MSPIFPYILTPPIITMPSLFLNMADMARPSGAYTYEGVIFSQ